MKKKKTLRELGFRRKSDPVLKTFGPPGPAPKKPDPIKPDFGLPKQEYVPQAPEFAEMWITHFQNASMKNPLGAPLEWYERG